MADKDKVTRYLEVTEVPEEDRDWIIKESLDIIQTSSV